MPNTGQGTTFNLPNYIGELFTASRLQTPLTSMCGGLNGLKQTTNFEFPIDQTYAHETPAQPAITEAASLTAPTPISYVRSQDSNVTQIFQEQVSITYEKLSNSGRLSGLSTAGEPVNPVSEQDFQIMAALQKIARDFEYVMLQGVYQKATAADVANKSRGINAAAGTRVNASSAALTKTLVQTLLKAMYDNGAVFVNPAIVVNSFQKQMLSSIYGYAPQDRNIGGINVKQIETDFGNLGVVLDSFQAQDSVTIVDMPVISVVTQPVPGKGNLFYEALSKTGAAESGQIYGKLGVNHGASYMHGIIYGLTTA